MMSDEWFWNPTLIALEETPQQIYFRIHLLLAWLNIVLSVPGREEGVGQEGGNIGKAQVIPPTQVTGQVP